MLHLVKTEEEWQSLREKYITASEAAVLIGMNPYSSPGKLKKNDGFKGNSSTIVGQVLEPVVVNITNRVLNESFKLYEKNTDEKSFYTKGSLGATPDATNDTLLLECKTTRPDLFLRYRLDPPTNYLVQLQVQMWCTDINAGYLSIMSTDLSQKRQEEPEWPIVIFKVVRSDKLCNIIEQEASRFNTEEKFRVNSVIKKQAGVLLHMSYERVFPLEIQENNYKNEFSKLLNPTGAINEDTIR